MMCSRKVQKWPRNSKFRLYCNYDQHPKPPPIRRSSQDFSRLLEQKECNSEGESRFLHYEDFRCDFTWKASVVSDLSYDVQAVSSGGGGGEGGRTTSSLSPVTPLLCTVTAPRPEFVVYLSSASVSESKWKWEIVDGSAPAQVSVVDDRTHT